MTFAVLLAANVTAYTGYLLDALIIAVAWRLSRGGGGSAVSELSKANEVLEKRVNQQGSEIRDLRIENGRLKERTDFQAVIVEYEKREVLRHHALLVILGMIAKKLGAEEMTE